ncbi:50S ribosomal protein L6 [Alphaproteobacteria bacterium]|nr:50S ribosomal protein L6 [Alphaproteobacteria bacterium]
MSRIGQNPVSVPVGVTVEVVGQLVTAKGKLGELSMTLVDEVEIASYESTLVVKPRSDTQRARTMWGTMRSLVQNIVTGVDEGFTVNLEIIGVGYRAAVEGKELVLQLGYSHEIRYPIPEGITIACERPTVVAVAGADRQLVGQVAANIRAFRKPEPYKGKGIRYVDEFILRKEGKKK